MQHVINIHKLDNADKALNKDMQTNNETQFLYASHVMHKRYYQPKIVHSYTSGT